MSISQKLENKYKNIVESIKKETNRESKIRQIGALIMDLGDRSINAVAIACGCCWRYAKNAYVIVRDGLAIVLNKNKCGRKKKTEQYLELEADIKTIIDEHSSTEPRFKTEKKYVKLTLKEITKSLLDTNKYEEGFIGKSCLAYMLNEIGYNLKKVKKTKPLKKIKETDAIFENVHKKREEAMKDEKAALISIDAKDKVLIGPYSRGGKSRVLVEACDHDLTNRCITPIGILDLKNNQTYFYNFTHKPTSLAIVDCIEDYIIQNRNYDKINILMDNGPDNSGVRTIFLKGLIDLHEKYKVDFVLVYYPPYHSKYNPVERVWARIENIWNGELLLTEDICNKFMENLTWNGVKAKLKYITKEYEKGLKINKDEMLELEKEYIHRDIDLRKYSLSISKI